jgi:hypothetical protein
LQRTQMSRQRFYEYLMNAFFRRCNNSKNAASD